MTPLHHISPQIPLIAGMIAFTLFIIVLGLSALMTFRHRKDIKTYLEEQSSDSESDKATHTSA